MYLMKNIQDYLNTLSTDEKCRLFNGYGAWQTYNANGKLPQIFMCDGPHGLRKQDGTGCSDVNASHISTCFPTSSCIASSWDVNATAKLGKSIAIEARAEDVQLILGPGVNIKRSPLCGRNFEYFSEDPLLTGKLASSYINAMQSLGVGACVKHFACNNQERRRQTVSSNVDEKTLREIYLRAFEYIVKNANPAAIMCSYNRINGTYVCHNRHILTEILRDEWKYQGVVISDWGACVNPPECLQNGMDLAMPDSNGYITKKISEAYNEGMIKDSDLERANSRVLNMVQNLLEAQKTPAPQVDFNVQHQTAIELAEQSAVLLKNDGVLPLKTGNSVTLIGELAEYMKFQGGGSSHINTKPYPNSLEEFAKAGFTVTYEKGYFSGYAKKSQVKKLNSKYSKQALETAKNAAAKNEPVLYFCGLTDIYEGESFDRTTMELPPEQVLLLEKLLEITKNVIIISFSGSPINLTIAKNTRAILHMYLCGEGCSSAIVNLVSGKANPSGHLAETWPLKIEDTPCYGNFGLNSLNADYKEGTLVGYRWYFAKKIPVQYAFGFGLSYTNFDYTNLTDCTLSNDDGVKKLFATTSANKISVTVTNNGDRSGSEVIQVYKKYDDNNIALVGFTKVPLEAGESKTVSVDLVDYIYNGDSSPCKSDKIDIVGTLEDVAEKSIRARFVLWILTTAIRLSHPGQAKDDPAVRIEISAIRESPLESLVSLSGGRVSEKLAKKIAKWGNY